ncbi:MAG: hypothetical protein ACYC97_05605 [Metallibacterium sp.]
MTQLTTPEMIAGGIGALAGVLSFLSAVLPKASEEETIINNILNLIHGAGFNSGKIVQPKTQAEQDFQNSALTLISEAVSAIKSTTATNTPSNTTPIVPVSNIPPNTPASTSVNPATPVK